MRRCSERVAIGKAIEERLGERRGSNQYQARSEHPHNSAEAPPTGTETRDIAAKRAGFDSTTAYRRAKQVVDSGAAGRERKSRKILRNFRKAGQANGFGAGTCARSGTS